MEMRGNKVIKKIRKNGLEKIVLAKEASRLSEYGVTDVKSIFR